MYAPGRVLEAPGIGPIRQVDVLLHAWAMEVAEREGIERVADDIALPQIVRQSVERGGRVDDFGHGGGREPQPGRDLEAARRAHRQRVAIQHRRDVRRHAARMDVRAITQRQLVRRRHGRRVRREQGVPRAQGVRRFTTRPAPWFSCSRVACPPVPVGSAFLRGPDFGNLEFASESVEFGGQLADGSRRTRVGPERCAFRADPVRDRRVPSSPSRARRSAPVCTGRITTP